MKVFTIFKSFLNYIDEGKFFQNPVKWLYMILAAANILLPLYMLYEMIDGGAFSAPAKYVILMLLGWLVMLVGFFFLGLLWWNRKDQLSTIEKNADFPVTPVFAHIIRTFGEWAGLLVGGVFFVVALLALIFVGDEAAYAFRDVPFLEDGWLALLKLPIAGFLTILVTRFVSEQVKVFVTIAKNTKK